MTFNFLMVETKTGRVQDGWIEFDGFTVDSIVTAAKRTAHASKARIIGEIYNANVASVLVYFGERTSDKDGNAEAINVREFNNGVGGKSALHAAEDFATQKIRAIFKRSRHVIKVDQSQIEIIDRKLCMREFALKIVPTFTHK